MIADGGPQLVDPVTRGRHRVDDHGTPIAELGQLQHELEVAPGLACTGAVRLVDDEQVGDLQEAGLVGLDGIAPPRIHHHDGGVGGCSHSHLLLADTDGLHQDHGNADGRQDPHGVRHGHSQTAEVAAGGHRADEDLVVEGVVLHPDPIPQDGPTRKGRGRVDGQHGHLVASTQSTRAGPGDQLIGERRLARTRSPGDADAVGLTG